MMNFIKRQLRNLGFAFKGIGSNKLTSFLTLLGIVIGIGSVIGLMGIGEGTQQSIVGELSTLGTDIVTLAPGANTGPPSREDIEERHEEGPSSINDQFNAFDQEQPELTIDDYNHLVEAKIENVASMTFSINTAKPVSTVMSSDEKFNDLSETASVKGVDLSYQKTYTPAVRYGSLLETSHIENESMVAIVGYDVLPDISRKKIMGTILYIEDIKFEVIGVLEDSTESLLGSSPNTEVLIPYTVFDKFGVDEKVLSSMIIKVEDDEFLEGTIEDIEASLLDFRGLDKPDFSFISIKSIVASIEQITGALTVLLSGIAAISLLVGGIGISNVMLITVTQRTREIGIRKAIGARRSDILIQFLTEAVLLTAIGGVLGFGFGVLLGVLAEPFMGYPAIITMDSVVLASGISIGIGIVFGILPANRASKLSPIDALRYE